MPTKPLKLKWETIEAALRLCGILEQKLVIDTDQIPKEVQVYFAHIAIPVAEHNSFTIRKGEYGFALVPYGREYSWFANSAASEATLMKQMRFAREVIIDSGQMNFARFERERGVKSCL